MTISPFPLPANEDARISALAAFDLMDTPPEEEFDRLAELAARLFKVPTVLISLIGNDRQFFKARVGFDPCETSREISFCAHAIMQEDILFIPDALKDERFAKNPLVLGPPFIRFYAGKPLVTPTGEKIGTVCLIDSKPHQTFSAEERKNLSDTEALVMDRMEMRRLETARDVSQTRFENIASTSPDAIICYNATTTARRSPSGTAPRKSSSATPRKKRRTAMSRSSCLSVCSPFIRASCSGCATVSTSRWRTG